MVWNRSTAFLALFASFIVAQSVSAETVLLDFHSAMCGPCQQMRPVLQQLAASGYKIRPVDIQRQPQLAAQYGVRRVPTFIALVDGRETSRVTGLTSISELQQMLGSPTPNNIATVSQGGIAPQPNRNDLNAPQMGRIVEIQNPNPSRPQPSAAANPFANAPTRQQGPSIGSLEKHRPLIESTVKITVEDPQGKSAGTGTVVDARSGEALVLTCGHIFRSSAGKGPITITLFNVSPTGVAEGSTYTGRLIEYDLERDLGLISFRPTEQLRPIQISHSSAPIPPGSMVTSVGCNGGQPPTALDSRVTANNRYQGPGNIEVAGAPVEGRSGGGLFSANGELIGVCFAADPQENEGLYASLESIHTKLSSLGLAMIYEGGAASSMDAPIRQVSTPQPARGPEADFAVRGQEPAAIPAPSSLPLPRSNEPVLSPVEQATFEEIQSRGANSEVICIIRPHDPSAKSEVITLNNASPGFVQKLTDGSNNAAPSQQPIAASRSGQMIR